MASVVYEFDTVACAEQKNYIFQLVKGRRLTNVYHSHDFYELICFLQGRGIQLINDKRVDSGKGEIVVLCPQDSHCFIGQSEDVEIISLSVKKEEFELFCGAYDPFLLKQLHGSPRPIFTRLPPESPWGLDTSALQSVTEYDCKLFLSFILHAYITGVKLQQDSGMPKQLSEAIERMKDTEHLKRGIAAFVALSHYSQSHLGRLIKAFFGVSLKQYINELRLQNAYRELTLTTKAAEEISEALGFSSFSHFNKIFKARFSVTPAALRKSNRVWTV